MSDLLSHSGDDRQDHPRAGDDLGGPDASRGALTVPVDDNSLLPAIIRLARDPSVDVSKLGALLEMQERMLRSQAEAEFNQALARLAGQMPRVKKNGRVTLEKNGVVLGSYPFARWEDIDRIIRPLMDAEGFTLSFTSQPRQGDGGGLVITGTLLHRNGHSMSATMPLPLDTGPGRNNLQATGSTLSYGKRYCAEMLLNIVREGDDDDGAKGGDELISDDQVAELSREMTEVGLASRAMLDLLGITGLPEIRKSQLAIARNAINIRRRRAMEKRS